MSTLGVFIILALIIAVILTLIVLLPWMGKDKTANYNQLIALNIEVFQDRIAELTQDYKAGVIDESTFIEHKTELERQLLQANNDNVSSDEGQSDVRSVYVPNRRSRLILWISIPLLMGLGYLLISDTKPTTSLWTAQDKLGQVADDLLTGKIQAPPEWASKDNIALFSALQMNVYEHSHDANRWMRLADIFMAFEANEPAFEAMSRAYRLEPNDASVATRFAQIQFFSHGGRLNAQGLQALNSVLNQDPNHQGAQMLMVMGTVQAGKFDEAQQWVDKLRASITNQGGDHSVALNSLNELTADIEQKKMQQQKGALAGTNGNDTDNINGNNDTNDIDMSDTTTANAQVDIVVNINPSLLPLLEPSDILFVTVKPNAGGAPLAAKRIPLASIEQSGDSLDEGIVIQLSDEDAMMPERNISSAQAQNLDLVITARISKSGQAISQSGDLSAIAVPVTDTKDPIQIEIAEQVQ